MNLVHFTFIFLKNFERLIHIRVYFGNTSKEKVQAVFLNSGRLTTTTQIFTFLKRNTLRMPKYILNFNFEAKTVNWNGFVPFHAIPQCFCSQSDHSRNPRTFHVNFRKVSLVLWL